MPQDSPSYEPQPEPRTENVPRPDRVVGRGSPLQPPNRFEKRRIVADVDEGDEELVHPEPRKVPTQFFDDVSQSIISHNTSPDIPFNYSLNPYRGCEHGCAYCYARPTHEWLGWSAGLDFETKIQVKQQAASLLSQALRKSAWRGDLLVLSGVTDCYQPAERQFGITRQCLEVVSRFSQAVEIVTKNALVIRDIDLLAPLAEQQLARVNISLTTLQADLARRLEPRTSSPAARLRAIRRLAQAGIPTRVMVAPVIPGLNDHEVPAILAAAADAGATGAGYILLRLPLTVAPIFEAWLHTDAPEAAARVLHRIRDTRHGQLSDSRFGVRMRGSGPYADSIASTFAIFAQKYQLPTTSVPLDTTRFRRPPKSSLQKRLFEDE